PVDPVDPVKPPKPVGPCTTVVACVTAESNEQALPVAHVLDTVIQQQTTSDLAKEFIGLNSQKAVSDAATETLPLMHGAGNRIVADAAQGAMQYVQARSQGTLGAALLSEDEARSQHTHVWGTAMGAWDKQNSRQGAMGYRTDHAGLIIGADTDINQRLRLGGALAYTHSDADSRGSVAQHSLKADTWQAIFYGDYAIDEAFGIDAQVGLGRSSIEGKRHIGFANKTAKSDYHATIVQAGTGLSYRIGDEKSHITPFARLDYTHVKSSAYKESGAGTLNLNVKRQTYDSLVWRAGVRAEHQVADSLALLGTASVGVESLDRDTPITAEFAGAPGLAFTTRSTDYGRLVGNVGVGVVYRPAKNVELIGRYGVNLRKGYTGQNASATLQVRW
ncbi:MAG: autotransporter outer membrane beta-barrel domain-containing protein, partial [Pelistega sp.]|nr:autotransporter outer membrane beta-barrel domain-containing protein [Pelistega sp.]